MNPEMMQGVSEAYGSELEDLFKAAESRGLIDPDFTAEKRAQYRELEKAAGMGGLAVLDEIAFAQMDGVEKIALYGGLGRLLSKEAGWFDALMGGAGKMVGGLMRAGGGAAVGAVERAGAGAAAKAVAAPSAGFLQAFARRGLGADAAKGVLNQYNKMGPMAYSRMRRVMGRPVAGAIGSAAAHAVGGAAKKTGWGEAAKELKSGLLFGGAFGLGGRLMGGGEEETKVQVGT